MKTTNKFLLASTAVAIMAIADACSSTEVVEPPTGYESKGKTITLTIGCPDANNSATRADNDHMLRYSALMYVGKSIEEDVAPVRKEAIATSGGSSPITITFDVPEGDYTFVIIGDYIPSNSEPDENGLYPDTYYDTHSDNARLYMLSFKDFYKNDVVYPTCLNNENYDCFARTITINKGEEEVTKEITLPRVVSRVSFVSNTNLDADIDEITFSDFDFFYTYVYSSKTGARSASGKISMTKATQNSMSNTQDNEVFFFYTLASDKRGDPLANIDFVIKFKDNTSRSFTTQGALIYPISNYKIKVMGNFLSDPVVPTGPINLVLTANEDEWDSESKVTIK